MTGLLRVCGLAWLVVSFGLPGASAGQSHSHFVRAGLLDFNRVPSAAREVLEHADEFELLSLSPVHQRQPAKDSFYGYKILGRTSVTDVKVRRQLVGDLERAAFENQGTIAACFNPRHGIRAAHDGRRADFVICFECFQVQVHGEGEGDFLISNSPKSVFDKVLRNAGVPLD